MNEPTGPAPDAIPADGDGITKGEPSRRSLLRKMGRFAAVTPPAVTLLLSLKSKPALAVVSAVSSGQFKEPVSLPPFRRLA